MRNLLSMLIPAALAGALGAQLPVVPAPQRVALAEGRIAIAGLACEHAAFAPQLAAFRTTLSQLGASIDAAPERGLTMRIQPFPDDAEAHPAESYRLRIHNGEASVFAADSLGVARGTATLCQLLEIEDGVALWPCLTIDDAPELPFRCFMVDLGRNPHSPQVLQHVVDLCWFYKVRFLQLHLSDDQLCSWPSRAFPKLRDERAGWTWEDFVALEAYAVARGVTLVPEIDVPGHSTILRARYPEVFGTSPEELATSPAATEGVKRLVDELLSVFQSTPYLHLGGDESGVGGDPLRDFLNRIAREVKARGRRAIVWEGPSLGVGEHKLDTDVLQMNWDTVPFPAQQMLDAGYQVVNAAWDPMYIVDHYPRTMFTAAPVRRCYDWDPRRFAHVDPGMPTFLQPHVTKTADGILGFCMPWWEGRAENLLGLCAPRLAAVAAGAWNRDGERDFTWFDQRQQRLLQRFEAIARVELPRTPFADPATQQRNLAFRGHVSVSTGASQPPFGPERLTNGITDRFDFFLGYPCAPQPLEITVELAAPSIVARVVVHETAVGDSHEVYELHTSADGVNWQHVGRSIERSARGDRSFVEHRFAPRSVRFVHVRTRGCHDLTFPSFSRLCEIEAFAD
ncbi:MAG: family 20 glycosylhydrolase [Planctomycetes bacterium]|nr:family 20 glycosylhydrolase [Planctomycetota bacterium]